MMIYKSAQADPQEIAAALKNGAAAVLPTDTVYGLCVLAAQEAKDKLDKIKNNPPGKPPQVLCTYDMALTLAENTPAFLKAAALWPGPLTLIAKSSPQGALLTGDTIGLRVPADDFILQIIKLLGAPLFASSANMHGAQVCESEADVLKYFAQTADIIVLKGDIKTKPSALVDISGTQIKVLREGALSLKRLLDAQ